MSDEVELSEGERALQEELRKWDAIGVMANSWMPNEGLIGIIARFTMVQELLVEKGLITEEEFQTKYEEVMLRTLREVREAITPIVQQQRLNAIKAAGNGISLPPGFKL